MLSAYRQINEGGIIKTREYHRDLYKDFFEKIKNGLIAKIILKSIGDWSQEIYTVSKKPQTMTIIGDEKHVYKSNDQLNNFVIGITEDRLSACRMLFLQIFGQNTNNLSISGAYSTNYKLLYGNKQAIKEYFKKNSESIGGKKRQTKKQKRRTGKKNKTTRRKVQRTRKARK